MGQQSLELRCTLPRLTHRHGLTACDVVDLINAFANLAEVIHPDAVRDSELRDAADRPVLGTLLALRERCTICTPVEFWARHGGP
jgi:hypothetical protein